MKTRKLQNDMYLETLDKRCSGYPIYKHRVKVWGRQNTQRFTDWAVEQLGSFWLWHHFSDATTRKIGTLLVHRDCPAWMIKYDNLSVHTEFYLSEEAVSMVVLKWQE